MPVPQLPQSKDGASFSLVRENNSYGGSSGSESDGQGVESHRTRKKLTKGSTIPSNGISSSNSEDERPSDINDLHLLKQPVDQNNLKISKPDIGLALHSQNPNPRPIKVIVVADVICPWCYIALRSIQLAIQDLTFSYLESNQLLPPPRFDIEFRPFFINDNFGSDEIAIDRRAFLEAKFGTKLEEHDRIVNERGKALGIDFKLGGMLRQTTRAHRLLTLAYRTGGSALQLALLEHLFNASHVEEKDIGNVELLAYYADKVGLLPKATADRWLRTHDLETDVRRLVKISYQGCGINGVPFVVINGKWAIGGGEDRAMYFQVFEKVWRGSI